MTVVTAIFIVIVTITTIFGVLMTLNRTLPFEQTGLAIGIEFGAAIFLAILTTLAMTFHWWLFCPLMLILFGIWQLAVYSHASWLIWLAMVIGTWISAGQTALGGGIVSLIAGRMIVLPLAALAYITMSGISYYRDHKNDEIVEAIRSLKD